MIGTKATRSVGFAKRISTFGFIPYLRYYSVDSIKRTVLLNVLLLPFFQKISIKNTVY